MSNRFNRNVSSNMPIAAPANPKSYLL